jgi:hypothetical protein
LSHHIPFEVALAKTSNLESCGAMTELALTCRVSGTEFKRVR